MKIFVLIMMFLTVPELFARDMQCNQGPALLSKELLSMDKSADIMNCVATKNKYSCQKVEDELEKEEKYKVIQCNAKSLEANRLGNVSITSCVWNGLKISGESLVNIAALPGAIASGIAKGFNDTQFCNASVDKKREILKAFNMSVDDPRFKLEEQRLGMWLNDAPCSEIEKLVSARYQNYQNTMMRERIAAINTGKKPRPVQGSEEDSKNSSLAVMLKSAMGSLEQTYECYTPKVKAEMICAGVTSLLADAALGGGVAMAAKRMAQVVKSSRAVGNIRAATASGQAVDLADAAVLLNRDRLRAAVAVLKREGPMTEAQNKAIIAAHEIGKKEGRGFYEYTQNDILKKARALREAGFSPEETRKLMEAGITGSFRNDSWARQAMVSYMDKSLKIATSPVQQEGLLALHELGMSSAKGFNEQALAILKKANFTDAQIEIILKAKLANEKGLLTAANVAAADKVATEAAALKAKKESEAAAARSVASPAQTTPVAQPAAAAASPGRQAVLNNFKSDPLINYKFVEIPEGATAEVLEARTNARRMSAQKFLTEMEKKGSTIQDTIFDSGEAVRKSKMNIKEAEEALSKLPEKGADLKRKELTDKIDRSKASYEMYQLRCKTVVDIYRVGYGIPQFLRQYEKDFEYNCK